MMGNRYPIVLAAAAFVAALTACSLEVNVQIDRDDEGVASIDAELSADFPANPFGADDAEHPEPPTVVEAPPAASGDRAEPPQRPSTAEPTPPRVPLPPAPPLFQAPVPTVVDGVVRDALWRRDLHVESKWVDIPEPDQAEIGPGDGPRFTPFTVAPRIENRLEVVTAIEEAYPEALKAAGIGGTVRVYFFIDDEGVARDVRIDRRSEYRAIDRAALEVARQYRFTPALNRGEPVAVWVSFPITFQP